MCSAKAVAGRSASIGRARQVDAEADREPQAARGAAARIPPGCPRPCGPSISTSLGHLSVTSDGGTIGVGEVGDRQRGDEGDLGRLGRRRVGGEEQGGGEVALAGRPGPAAAAAAGGLAPAVIQTGPRSPASARRRASALVESSLVEGQDPRDALTAEALARAQRRPKADAAASVAGIQADQGEPDTDAGKANRRRIGHALGVGRRARPPRPAAGSNHIILIRRR